MMKFFVLEFVTEFLSVIFLVLWNVKEQTEKKT